SAVTPTRDLEFLAVEGQVADHFVGVDIDHHRADGNADANILAVAAGHLPAHAVLSALRAEATLMAEVDEGGEAFVSHQPDAAAVATIAAIGSAEGNEFLAAETDATVAAVAGRDVDFRFVYKFHGKGSGKWNGRKTHCRCRSLARAHPGRPAAAGRHR